MNFFKRNKNKHEASSAKEDHVDSTLQDGIEDYLDPAESVVEGGDVSELKNLEDAGEVPVDEYDVVHMEKSEEPPILEDTVIDDEIDDGEYDESDLVDELSQDSADGPLDDSENDLENQQMENDDEALEKKPKKKGKKREEVSLPNMLVMGFQEATSKKDLLIFLNSKSREFMSPDIAHYNIIKRDGGYYWELQEGGSGHGALSSTIESLVMEDEVIIKTAGRDVRVVKRHGKPGVNSFAINEGETFDQSVGIEFKDKMLPITSRGTGLLVFGLSIAALGVLSVFASFVFKYGLLNENKRVELDEAKAKSPFSQVEKIRQVLDIERAYIETVSYQQSSDSYLIKTKTESAQAEKIDQAHLDELHNEVFEASIEPASEDHMQ